MRDKRTSKDVCGEATGAYNQMSISMQVYKSADGRSFSFYDHNFKAQKIT